MRDGQRRISTREVSKRRGAHFAASRAKTHPSDLSEIAALVDMAPLVLWFGGAMPT